MKKLIFVFIGIAILGFLGLSSFIMTPPSASGRVITDTIQGNETVNFSAMLGMKQATVTCTQLGGTSDGTLLLQGSSNGTSFVTLTEGVVHFYPNDTLTITNGAVWIIDASASHFNYYRVRGAGTVGDTTLITIDWSKN